jgi:hypothetical protein
MPLRKIMRRCTRIQRDRKHSLGRILSSVTLEKLPTKYIRANDVAATHHDRTSAMMKVDMGTRRMDPEFCYPVFVCSYIVRLLFCLCKEG